VNRACRDCGFFSSADPDDSGICLRFPPHPRGDDGTPIWPRVGPANWCGEFSRHAGTTPHLAVGLWLHTLSIRSRKILARAGVTAASSWDDVRGLDEATIRSVFGCGEAAWQEISTSLQSIGIALKNRCP